MSSAKPTVLVLGGTGNTGTSILDGLVRAGNAHVVVASRATSSHKPAVQALKDRGVEIRTVDFVNDEPTKLEQALTGVDILISVVSFQVLDSQTRVFDAAEQAGVKRVIPCDWGTYCPGPGIRDLHDQKLAIHDHIKHLGLTYTFIDVGWWMQLQLPYSSKSQDPLAGMSWEFVGSGDVKNAVTSLPKIGEFVARIIQDPRTENQYVFIWEDEVTLNEAWAIAERVSGEGAELRAKKIQVSEHELTAKVEAARAELSKGFALMPHIALSSSQYKISMYIREDNTIASAKAGGALDARELYPDIPVQTLEAYAKTFYSQDPPQYRFD